LVDIHLFSPPNERKLVQRGVVCVVELGDRNIEKSSADFRREAQANSKNEAVPRPWLQPEEAEQITGKQLHRIRGIRESRTSPKCGPDGLNLKTPVGYLLTGADAIKHRSFRSRRVAPEKQRGAKS
jgi:hypothetical protein